MIPLKDLTPRRSFPLVTLFLLLANVAVFLYQLSLPPHASQVLINTYGLVPHKVEWALEGRHYSLAEGLVPFVTCMFLHGGFLHIIGNMLFLWIFGGNVEDRLRPGAYLLFYLFTGVASGAAQVIFSWGSRVPSIGASGAISGVLGAYLILYPASQILTLVPIFLFFWTVRLPAFLFIGLWFVLQCLSGLSALDPRLAAGAGGVAWWAHVGGFLAGALLAIPVRLAGRRADN